MPDRMALIHCDCMAPEVEALLSEPEFAEMQAICVPAECDRPQLDAVALEALLADHPECVGSVLLVGDDCFLAPQVSLDAERYRHLTLHACMADLAGADWLDERLAAGDHISTLGLLRHWQRAWQRWGFDEEGGRGYFAESTRRLVLLDSRLDPAAADELEAFAMRVQRPSEVVEVRVDTLRARLSGELALWRRTRDLEAVRQRHQGCEQQLADYAMIHDLVSALTAFTETAEVESRLLELFTMLCAPRLVLFRPTDADSCSQSPAFVEAEPDLCFDLSELQTGYVVLPGDAGFMLAIERAGECFGALAVVDIAFPERLQHYLNLALSLAPVLALALANARTYQQRLAAEERVQALNHELRQQLTTVEALNGELESFTYSVSHDLRAPLRSLDGFSHILERDYPDKLDERGQHFLSRIRANAVRMGQLIDDLLRLSRLTRGALTITPVDLGVLAGELLDDLQQTEPERQVTVEVAGDLQARGDARLLRAALENLIGNAWKYSSKVDKPIIRFDVSQADGERVYTISDNGAGFDMAYADKLFTPFQRLHGDEFPGTGIGLATVQRIIQRHGGRIWAESTPGEGASFHFTLAPSDSPT